MIFVCLGNQGEKYKNTRHNVGRMFGDYLKEAFKVQDQKKIKDYGWIFKLKNDWQVVFLNCFMNESGPCLQSLLGFVTNHQSLITNRYFIVHDDLDLDFGSFKIQSNRSSAGHKGVQLIFDTFGTQDFQRIRIGIGRDQNIPEEKYVLMRFTKEEQEKLEKVFEEIANLSQRSLK